MMVSLRYYCTPAHYYDTACLVEFRCTGGTTRLVLGSIDRDLTGSLSLTISKSIKGRKSSKNPHKEVMKFCLYDRRWPFSSTCLYDTTSTESVRNKVLGRCFKIYHA